MSTALHRVYNRTDLLDRRRSLMAASADCVCGNHHRQRGADEAGRGVIPVEVTTAPWHYTTFWDWADHWQTLLAGFLAFVAGVGAVLAAIWAIWATRSTAKKQIDASREDADRVIAATREQTEVTAKQTDTTVRLQQTRDSSEASAFHAMLAAAMDRVLAEAAWGQKDLFRNFDAIARGV